MVYKAYVEIPEGYVRVDVVKEKRLWLLGSFYKVRLTYDWFQHRDYAEAFMWVKTITKELPEGASVVRPTLSFKDGVKGHPKGWR